MRRPLLFAACTLLPLTLATCAPPDPLPVTGRPVESLGAFDRAMIAYMEECDLSAGTLAVMRDGRVVLERGYGWRDARRTEPTPPGTPMRIASVSKPITAAVIHRLVEASDLALEDRPFDLLDLTPPDGAEPDPRLGWITVEHLLAHRAGWDSAATFDPMFHDRAIREALGLDGRPTAEDIIRYMLGRPLDFDPGERFAYSNFGYCVLGRVIERVTGEPYEAHVQRAIAEPLGMATLRVARTDAAERPPDEVEYPLLDGLLAMERMDAHGGLIGSAADLCRFMGAYRLDGRPRGDGERADFTFVGSLPGTTAIARQRPDGVVIAALFNGRRDRRFREDLESLLRRLDDAADSIERW